MLDKIYDLSFAGSTITIDGAVVKDFMDDANPIDIQDTETANIEWSCNGRMIRTIKPAAVIISVTVIPNSPSDNRLRTIWKRSFANGGSVSLSEANKGLTCTIQVGRPKGGSFQFAGGSCLSGAAAVTSNGQGKMGGNTYTFAFELVV